VDDVPEEGPGLSTAEMDLLLAAGEGGAPESGSEAASAINADLLAAFSEPAGVLELVKSLVAPGEVGETGELAQASQPAAAPWEKQARESLERRGGRSRRAEILPDGPIPELPEPAEPATNKTASAGTGKDEIVESRLEIVSAEAEEIPDWSDELRVTRPLDLAEELFPPDAAAMEKAVLEAPTRVAERRVRRQEPGSRQEAAPEPRNDIPDSIRSQTAEAPAAGDNLRKNAEVEEMRPAVLLAGRPETLERPELIPAGAATPGELSRPRPSDRAAASSLSGSPGELSRPRPSGRAAASSLSGSPGELSRPRPSGRAAASSLSGQPAGRRREGSASDAEFSDSAPLAGGARPSDAAARSDAGRGKPAASSAGRARPAASASGERRIDNLPDAGGAAARQEGKPSGESGRSGDASPAGPNGKPSGESGRSGDASPAGPNGKPAGESGRDGDASPASPGQAVSGSGGEADKSLTAWPWDGAGSSWLRGSGRSRRRDTAAVASSIEAGSVMLVVGDLVRLPDSAVENLFSALRRRLTAGVEIEERRLAAADATLRDCLLAVASPEAVKAWSGGELTEVVRYLAGGGHIWLDADSLAGGEAAMRRLAEAAGGSYEPLPESHPLAEGGPAGGLKLGEKLVAVSTGQNWRSGWRYRESEDDRALRFLVRALNYFLAGDSGAGIELGTDSPSDGLRVDSFDDSMPSRLAGAASSEAKPAIWEGLFPASAWRLPGWSDPGQITGVSDGKGGGSLRLDLGEASQGRVSLYRPLNPSADFSRGRSLSLDVYYDGRGGASLSLLLTLSQAGVWRDFESGEQELSPGWNHLEFPLRGGRFRQLSGGEFVSGIAGLERVGRLGFLIRRGDPSAAIVMLREARAHGE
jgi:hypothetical protein